MWTVATAGGLPNLDWIENKVDIHKFMIHFKGEFWGVDYDHSYPLSRHFKIALNCKQFVDFINFGTRGAYSIWSS